MKPEKPKQSTIPARFEDGVFRPESDVQLPSGARVQLQVLTGLTPEAPDLSEIEAGYSALDRKYPLANARAAYQSREDLHNR